MRIERTNQVDCMVYRVWCAPPSCPVCCVYRATPPSKQSIDRDSVLRPILCLSRSNCRSRSVSWNDTPLVCVEHPATQWPEGSSRRGARPRINCRSLCDRSCPAWNQSSPDYTDYSRRLWPQPVNYRIGLKMNSKLKKKYSQLSVSTYVMFWLK